MLAGQSRLSHGDKAVRFCMGGMVRGHLLIVDGTARVLTTLFGELRNAVFASISQGAIRKVARETFDHLLSMDMKFHLERQTGGLTRAIDRGTK